MQEILRAHRVKYLPISRDESQRMVVRRRHVWEDALNRFEAGIKENKYIKVTFVGEPAVDQGGSFFTFCWATSHAMFCGSENSRVPVHNMTKFRKRSYYHVGAMIATSIIHGGPAPNFFADAVADYFCYGISGVKATPADIPN